MSVLLLKRLPAKARPIVIRVGLLVAGCSMVLWVALGLPLLSQIGAAALTYLVTLTGTAAVWRVAKKTVRKARKRLA